MVIDTFYAKEIRCGEVLNHFILLGDLGMNVDGVIRVKIKGFLKNRYY